MVDRPVPVEVVTVEYVPVPHELLLEAPERPIPEQLTYGEAIALWAEDRASLGAVNGRLRAIATLEEPL